MVALFWREFEVGRFSQRHQPWLPAEFGPDLNLLSIYTNTKLFSLQEVSSCREYRGVDDPWLLAIRGNERK